MCANRRLVSSHTKTNCAFWVGTPPARGSGLQRYATTNVCCTDKSAWAKPGARLSDSIARSSTAVVGKWLSRNWLRSIVQLAAEWRGRVFSWAAIDCAIRASKAGTGYSRLRPGKENHRGRCMRARQWPSTGIESSDQRGRATHRNLRVMSLPSRPFRKSLAARNLSVSQSVACSIRCSPC
jgi:hypothetical protein